VTSDWYGVFGRRWVISKLLENIKIKKRKLKNESNK